MKTFRFVHTADFHLGVGLRGVPSTSKLLEVREKDFEEQLKRIAEITVKSESDFLLICGDVFHSLRPSGKLLTLFSRFIANLTQRGIPVIVVAGNHDQPRTLRSDAYLNALHELKVPHFHYFNRPGSIKIKCPKSRRTVKIIGLPFVPLGLIKPPVFERFIDETLNSLVTENSDYDYLIVASHFHLEGAKLGREPYYLPLREVKLPKSIFKKPEVSYVALGHIHLHQEIDKGIVYSGSIERMNFGEEGESKGIVIVNERGGELSYEFQELPCRPLITLPKGEKKSDRNYFDITSKVNPEYFILNSLKSYEIPEGAIIRLLVKMEYGKSINRARISDYLSSLKVLHWFIEPIRVSATSIQLERKFTTLKEAFQEYVKHLLNRDPFKKLPNTVLKLIFSEGIKIIEHVEREG
ncbi:MAG: exonuclease SbcCD subunit D [archaeon GB-1845-036]|nr:exonuclease SbcCD subunit D [Candidatus Culexmicrobium thermophilum]